MITIKIFLKDASKSTFRSIFCRNMFEDMWIELLCGLVIYGVWKQFLSDDTGVDDSHLAETFSSHAAVLFTVADRLKKLYCGKVFVGLNIPDTVSASRQNIDIVLVTDREVVVVSVQNVSGLVSVDEKDGSWTCTSSGDTHRHHKSEKNRLPDPVAQAKRQVSILESYLEQRGLELPEGYLSFKVICPNSTFSFVGPSSYTHEVITYDQWSLLKPESKSMLSGWIKGALSWKKDSQNSWHEKLNQILTTAPIWDRIELKGNKLLLGEFVEFKGKHEDVQELRHVKRSKVGRVIIQKTSMFGLAPSKLQVVYYPRDYRREGSSSLSEWNEVTVKANTEVLFQPQNSDKVRKFKLSSVTSLSLSA